MSIQTREEKVIKARAELRRAEQALQDAIKQRENEPGPGSKILIRARFHSGSKQYEYLALRPETAKRDGELNWYVTGRAGMVTWESILDRVTAADISIHTMNFIV